MRTACSSTSICDPGRTSGPFWPACCESVGTTPSDWRRRPNTAAASLAYQLLQENGHFVLRFLAEDVGKCLDQVLDAILRTMSGRRRSHAVDGRA
jgi:hypothetical protein